MSILGLNIHELTHQVQSLLQSPKNIIIHYLTQNQNDFKMLKFKKDILDGITYQLYFGNLFLKNNKQLKMYKISQRFDSLIFVNSQILPNKYIQILKYSQNFFILSWNQHNNDIIFQAFNSNNNLLEDFIFKLNVQKLQYKNKQNLRFVSSLDKIICFEINYNWIGIFSKLGVFECIYYKNYDIISMVANNQYIYYSTGSNIFYCHIQQLSKKQAERQIFLQEKFTKINLIQINNIVYGYNSNHIFICLENVIEFPIFLEDQISELSIDNQNKDFDLKQSEKTIQQNKVKEYIIKYLSIQKNRHCQMKIIFQILNFYAQYFPITSHLWFIFRKNKIKSINNEQISIISQNTLQTNSVFKIAFRNFLQRNLLEKTWWIGNQKIRQLIQIIFSQKLLMKQIARQYSNCKNTIKLLNYLIIKIDQIEKPQIYLAADNQYKFKISISSEEYYRNTQKGKKLLYRLRKKGNVKWLEIYNRMYPQNSFKDEICKQQKIFCKEINRKSFKNYLDFLKDKINLEDKLKKPIMQSVIKIYKIMSTQVDKKGKIGDIIREDIIEFLELFKEIIQISGQNQQWPIEKVRLIILANKYKQKSICMITEKQVSSVLWQNRFRFNCQQWKDKNDKLQKYYRVAYNKIVSDSQKQKKYIEINNNFYQQQQNQF